MSWTVRSITAFGVGMFALTIGAEALYHLIGSSVCSTNAATGAIRCSEESGWWIGVLVASALVLLGAMRSISQPAVARALLGGALLAGGLALVWAVADDRTDAAGWAVGGAVGILLGVGILAGLAAAAARAYRGPEITPQPPETLSATPAQSQPADAPGYRIAGGRDPFGREPGEGDDPFGRG
jgi:hypothetical protein